VQHGGCGGFSRVTFLSVVLALLVASLLGCAVPARRAIRVDPAIALGYE